MREIKFRAWDNVTDEMFNPETENNNEMFFVGLVNGKLRCSETQYDDGDDFILMQYTGLKDKNGKEIYEGDLISVINDTFQAEVIYEAPSFKLKWRDDFHVKRNAENKTIAWNAHIIYEVVGNIYQDKHLLEGE